MLSLQLNTRTFECVPCSDMLLVSHIKECCSLTKECCETHIPKNAILLTKEFILPQKPDSKEFIMPKNSLDRVYTIFFPRVI